MAMAAMWFQQTYTFSSGNAILLMIFIGVVAVSMAVQAIVTVSVSLKAAKAVKDLADTAHEVKARLLPLIETAMDVSKTSQAMLREAAPKVRIITDNLVETSTVVRTSAQQFDKTFTDVNLRTQRQVARVDGMVSATLTATVEAVDSIQQGIRVPVQRIAAMANQARFALDGILTKVKSVAAKAPFGNR
jgi:methyl-accepting chemotaxis protein